MSNPAARPGPSLKARALRYLAAREHSRAELAAKLARFVTEQDAPDAVERVLDDLSAKGFINEDAGQAVAVARLDNLGKGASGAAVQNLQLMLGLG